MRKYRIVSKMMAISSGKMLRTFIFITRVLFRAEIA
jgi:hypothetical protein